MWAIVLDTNMLGFLAKSEPDCIHPKLAKFVDDINERKYRVIVPAPIITEVLVHDKEFLKKTGIDRNPIFTVAPLDEPAAVVAAEITQKLANNAKENQAISSGKQKTKVDVQIVAIACVQNARVIYSNDKDIKTITKQAGINISVQNQEDILQSYPWE